MSYNYVCDHLHLIDYSINKKFIPYVNDEYFTLDLHFDDDIHFTNWGRFYSYDAAYEFGCRLITDPLPDYSFKYPISKRPMEDPQCSAE